MTATVESVLRRVRGVVGTAGLEQLDLAGARLVVGKLLFDGDGIPDWHHRAACQEQDPEMFFPNRSDEQQIQAAQRVCSGCPVRSACLAEVMAWEPPGARYGVVGGLSAQQRRRMQRTTRGSQNSGEAA